METGIGVIVGAVYVPLSVTSCLEEGPMGEWEHYLPCMIHMGGVGLASNL